jgi:hypothetical protein
MGPSPGYQGVMRAMFGLYLTVIAAGLAVYIVVGLTHH